MHQFGIPRLATTVCKQESNESTATCVYQQCDKVDILYNPQLKNQKSLKQQSNFVIRTRTANTTIFHSALAALQMSATVFSPCGQRKGNNVCVRPVLLQNRQILPGFWCFHRSGNVMFDMSRVFNSSMFFRSFAFRGASNLRLRMVLPITAERQNEQPLHCTGPLESSCGRKMKYMRY